MAEHMPPAHYVIMRFGGVRKTAKTLGRTPACVSKWQYAQTKDGLKGLIPSNIQPKILLIARRKNIDITAEDLILGRTL